MYSLRVILIAVLILSASAPQIAAEEPRLGQARLVLKIPPRGTEIADCYGVAVNFVADGQRLFLTGRGAFWLYDLKSGKELDHFTYEGNSSGYYSPGYYAFSPNGKLVAGNFGNDQEVLVLDTASKKIVVRLPQKVQIGTIDFSSDGETLITSDEGGTALNWWDTKTWKQRRHLKLQIRGPTKIYMVNYITLSPDGKLASVHERGEAGGTVIRLYDLKTGAQISELMITKMWEGISIAFSPDSRYLATATDKNYVPEPGAPEFTWFFIYLWDLSNGKMVREFRQPFPPHPDWRTKQGRSEWLRHLHRNKIWSSGGLAFSHDGKTLVNTHKTMQLWEVASGKVRHQFTSDNRYPLFREPRFSPDGRLLAVTEILWDRSLPQLTKPKAGCAYVWDWRDLCLEQPKNLGPRGIERLWSDLASEDATVGYRAIAALLAKPEIAVAALAERLQRVEPIKPGEVDRLIADLDDVTFAVREKAVERLAALNEAARPALLRIKGQRPSLEMRRRVENLLARFDQPAGGLEHLRCLRAIEVLEAVGTPEARRVIAKLASGYKEAVETEDAKNALKRMDRR